MSPQSDLHPPAILRPGNKSFVRSFIPSRRGRLRHRPGTVRHLARYLDEMSAHLPVSAFSARKRRLVVYDQQTQFDDLNASEIQRQTLKCRASPSHGKDG